ncbi:hypothetical protein [Microbacterium sp.]|uniref:hypothetical protein n=1 Tax=Microbacterium sp. TaxID=51671 RepID=UPI002E38011C|nr:hypothetical protein [Microbacterium sp.]HEX5728479.1 hypothetical protein [Microbacterium sp.]
MKTIDIPDAKVRVRNLDAHPHLECEGFGVYEWVPERDGDGVATEVHLVLDFPSIPMSVVLGMKSADAVDRLIAALMRHRNAVFGASES